MLKKLLFMTVVMAFLAVASFGQPSIGIVYHEIEIVDEEGIRVTDITSVEIYNPDTTTAATIYKSPGAVDAMTNPILTDSTNTTLVNGYVSWWGPASYDFSITDGTNVHTNYGFRNRTPSEGRITFPSYLHAASTVEWADDESITLGTSPDWVINAGTTEKLITFTPASDASVFRVGLADGTKCSDLQWYTASAVGLLISESANTFAITGLTTSINTSSSYATSINAGTGTGDVHILDGTGTGAISIGSEASGVWAINGTSSGTINADDSIAMTVSAGTIGLASTGGDLTIDSTDKSVIIRGTEEAADAILLDADGTAGGIELQCGTGDITLDSGDDIFLEANTGTGDVISLICTKGTADASIVVTSTVGGIDVDAAKSITLTSSEETTDAVDIEASGTAGGVIIACGTGDITLDSGDDIFLAADTGTGDVISIINTQGTSAAAIVMTTTAAGSFDINSGDNITIDAEDDFTLTTAGGAIGIAATGGDITIDGVDQSVIIRGTEAATDAILLDADAGSIDIDSADNITIDVADDITIDTAEGKIHLIADGSTVGDITLDAEDDIILITTGTLTITNTDAATVSGDLEVTGTLTAVGAYVNPFEIVVATNEIEITESGTVFVLTHGTEYATTLPTVASSAGVTFRFIVGAVPSGDDYTVVTDSSENKISGSVTVNGAAVAADGPDDTITFTRDAAAIGDWCELTSDGVGWYLSGQGVAATSIVPSGT